MCTLIVCTDASVRGNLYDDPISGRPQRYKVGPATVACVAWAGYESSAVVLEMGVRLEGEFGPQRAEYEAVTVGLGQVLGYVTESQSSITTALLLSDNETVVSTLIGRKGVSVLAPYRAQARRLQGCLEHFGVEVQYEHVSRKDPRHKQAHQLADLAWRKPQGL